MSVESFQEDLDLLIEGLRELSSQEPNEEAASAKQLKRLYRSLHSQMAGLRLKELKGFSRDQQLVMSYLEMGSEPFERFHASILPKIGPSAKETAVAIAKFTNSSEAHDLVNNKQDKMSQGERTEVRALLGGILGVAVGDEFIRSVRGEMMGRVIAYALSGLCEEDLADYAKLDKSKRSVPSRDAFLLSRIVARDAELVYSITSPEHGSNVWPLACSIDEGGAVAAQTTKKKQRADTCIVNHAKKKIVFGSITSNTASNKKQALPMAKMIAALQLLTSQRYIGGDSSRPNPYYGYAVEPFYFHTGAIPVEKVATLGMGPGAALFQMLSFAGASVSKSEHRAIAKMAFFSLLGESNPNAATARSMALLNVHICGCDTLELYNKMKAARRPSAPARAFPKLCLSSINEALEVLARKDTTVSTTELGQNLLLPAIESIMKSSAFYFINFPATSSAQVDSEEFKLIRNISKNMLALASKLDRDGSGLGHELPGMLEDQAQKWSSRESVALQASRDSRRVSMEFVWDEAAHAGLVQRMGLDLDGSKSREVIIDNILTDFSNRTMPAILSKAMELALSSPGKLANAGWVARVGEQVTRTAQGGHGTTRLKQHASANSFNQTFLNVMYNSDEGHPGATIVKSLRPLFREGLWASRPGMPKNPEAREAVSDMLDYLMELDGSRPDVANFFTELSKLAHPATAIPAPVVKKSRSVRR